MPDLDPAAVEADKMWAEIQRLRTERDEARASLERERKARKAVEAYVKRVGTRLVDRAAMAIWDAEAICRITCESPGPDDFYDATVARGAYPGSVREARRVAWFALRLFFGRRHRNA